MPPNQDVVGPYLQCKHFLMGKACVKTPCKFAHGDDELEIWDLLRGSSKFPVIKLYSIIKHAGRHISDILRNIDMTFYIHDILTTHV